MFNVWMTIYAMAKYGISNGLGDIYQGDCTLVGRYNALVHSGINIVSTLLLSSSSKARFRVAPYSRLRFELRKLYHLTCHLVDVPLEIIVRLFAYISNADSKMC